MKKLLKKNKMMLIGIFIGAIGGFIYWQQIGCASGKCMITSSPSISTIYGAIMGGLLFSNFQKPKQKTL